MAGEVRGDCCREGVGNDGWRLRWAVIAVKVGNGK